MSFSGTKGAEMHLTISVLAVIIHFTKAYIARLENQKIIALINKSL